MTTLSKKQLASFNREGLIASSLETESDLIRREKVYLEFQKRGSCLSLQDLPFIRSESFQKADLFPRWISFKEGSKGLSLWEAGALWILSDEKGQEIPLLQMKKKLLNKGSLYGVSFDEVALHECIHAARSELKSDRFEEMIAYQFSPKKWRRFLGPLFRSPKESTFFVCTLVLPFFSFFSFTYGFSFFVPAGLTLLLFLIRLIKEHRIVKKCLASLSQLFEKETDPLTVLIRLTDEEVLLFAKKDLLFLKEYILRHSSLRWRQILASYPLKESRAPSG